jgi:hypothetical protein
VAYFKVLPRNSPGGTEDNNYYLSQDNRCTNRDLNPGLPEYEAVLLKILSVLYVQYYQCARVNNEPRTAAQNVVC